MPHYRKYDYAQLVLLPIEFKKQISAYGNKRKCKTRE
jgi:hypothetical protein